MNAEADSPEPANDDAQRTPWHAIAPDAALDRLDASEDGLDQDERRKRRERHGPNRLPERKRPSVVILFLRQFRDPLIYVLLAAVIISVASGNFNNAIFIGAVLLFNASLGTWQEARAEKSASALQSALRIIAVVRIDGERQEVDAEDIVPGDIVEIEEGASVPVDARLLTSRELRVDESLLTGESTPVGKDAEDELDAETALAERTTLVHAGSMALSGSGTAVACRTGTATEMGRIAASLAGGQGNEPPLVVRLRRLTRLIAYCILGAIVVLGVILYLRGDSWQEIFFLAVALAVSAIPAGLPVAITVALSIASKRMANRHVIVRELPAVEGLGACTCIVSDKTGTLTANQLTVRRFWMPGGQAEGREVELGGEALELEGELRCDDDQDCDDDTRTAIEELARSGLLASDAELEQADEGLVAHGDTVDVAFAVAARKLGLEPAEQRERYERLGEIPFSSARRFAASFNRMDDAVVAHVKGAAATIAERCEIDAEQVQAAEERLASQGFRVLAVASGVVGEDDARDAREESLQGLRFLGLVGQIDPIRAEVPEAVDACDRAGISVRMVTGDHPGTGLSIARRLDITTEDDEAITGPELREVVEKGEDDRIEAASVFARVEPTQKTDIVRALERKGHFIAVTGDGANDAPALKEGHIGVAMGEGGTDVARNTADLILTDDNFASIVAGIEEGRIAYSNVRKVVWLLLSTGAGEVLLFFLAVGFGHPLPLLPVQLLWLNLVTNGIQDVALAFERGEPGLLDEAPRAPDEPIFNRQMVEQVLISGLYIGSVSFAVFHYLYAIRGMEIFD
ncbi:MAG: cation-translocating P-type ATPase, partial [Planctomycetota bacterium]